MKRAAPWIVVGVLSLLVALTAFGVNQVIRRFLELPDGAEAAVVVADAGTTSQPAPVAGTPAIMSKRQYIDGILARNIFDSSAIGREAAATASDTSLEDLNLRLIGTMVAAPARFSAAFISENTDDAQPLSYGIEDRIADATIIAIEVDTVTLRRGDDSTEVLSMTDEEPARTPAARTASSGDDDDDGVEKVDDNNYVIDRELVDRYLTDLDAISRLGRAIPHRGSDGEIDGYRLSGVRRRSIGDKIGIKNGDIVHSVNGQTLNSMQGAMAAYQTLQSESSFTFEITRRGQRQTMSYQVQ